MLTPTRCVLTLTRCVLTLTRCLLTLPRWRAITVAERTPEQLFRSYIENGEYGLALNLAKLYALDADEVYKARCAATQHVANRYVRGFGWEMAHEAVSRRPPISLDTIVALTKSTRTPRNVGVCPSFMGHTLSPPCQTLA